MKISSVISLMLYTTRLRRAIATTHATVHGARVITSRLTSRLLPTPYARRISAAAVPAMPRRRIIGGGVAYGGGTTLL